MDWRKKRVDPAPLQIDSVCVERRFLRLLKKCYLETNLLHRWFAGCTAKERKALQVGHKIGTKDHQWPPAFPADSQGLNRTRKILSDPSHPGQSLFNLLPSVRRYRVQRSQTNGLRNTFFPGATTLLNNHVQQTV